MPWTIFINQPSGPVPRNLLITGQVPPMEHGVSSMNIQIGAGGQVFKVNAPSGAGATLWGWQGIIPSYIRPGQAFTIYLSAVAFITNTNDGRPPGEHESIEVDGAGQIDVVLENVAPSLTVDAFQSPEVTTGATLPFTLAGSYSSGGGDPSVYQPKLTYQVDGDGPHPITADANHRWSVPLTLTPGVHAIIVHASDNFTAIETRKSLTVLRYAGPTGGDASVPKTAAGAPTTASVTSWMRLEPQTSGADLDDTARARLFDPLWMMTRQWQIGEFQGEDAGSPVQTRVRSTSAVLSRAHMGELTAANVESRVYDPTKTPLETLVERRAMRAASATDTRMLTLTVDAGLRFLRMLELDPVAAKYRPAFLAKYALQPLAAAAAAAADPDTLRFAAVMAGRAPDARQLSAAIRLLSNPATPLDPALNVADADAAAVRKVAAAWLVTYDSLFTEPAGKSDAWAASRLEYGVSVSTRFSAQATDQLTLSASEFSGGRLDWSSFDVNGALAVDSTGDKPFKSLVELTVPAPVTFRGAPAARFWELEDAKIAYGLMTTGPTDLAHLMMIEFASSYGNDWYVVPMTLPVGSVTRVESLVVTDTFGVRSLLRPIGDPLLPPAYFSMWQLAALRPAGASEAPPVPNRFFLPPTIARSLDGGPLEDVLFMRDEMANLAWGIERTIENPIGAALSLSNPPPVASTTTTAPAPAGAPPPRYTLSAVTPANWVPLMPVQVDAKGTVQLKPAIALQPDGSNRIHTARSQVLHAVSPMAIYDEEIPREGVRVTRQRRMTRWTDGSTWVWTAYRNDVGLGEGSAGLRFDQVDDGGTTAT